MPVSNKASAGRYEMREPVTVDELVAVANDPAATALQTAEPLTDASWKRIGEVIVARRPDIEIRVYGHYSSVCDLGFLRHLPNLRRFSANALHGEVRGLEQLGTLPELESLRVGMWTLQSLDFLSALPASLRVLGLGASKTKRLDLAPLRRFRKLEELMIESHPKNIEVVSELSDLQKVSLRSISTPDLGYLAPLTKLRDIWLGLGGIRDLRALHGKASVHRIELWQIRGLDDVGVIAELPGLRDVFLQSLPHVHVLPDLRAARELRRVVLINMNGLTDFGPLESAPALETFAVFEAKNVSPQALVPVLRNRSLKQMSVGLGSIAKNQAFEAMRTAASIGDAKDAWSVGLGDVT